MTLAVLHVSDVIVVVGKLMKKYFVVVYCSSFFLMVALSFPAVSQGDGAIQGEIHPNMFLNQAEIDAIRARVDNGEEPWFSAFNQLLAAADQALALSPPSVVGGAITPPHVSIHVYYSCNAHAAETNPRCAHRYDYRQAIAVSHAVRDLGLAYVLTDDTRYADKILALARVWALDPETYMEPFIQHPQSIIELSITIPGFLYGIDLIWNYAGWDEGERDAIQQWARDLGWNASEKFTEVWYEYGKDANFENWKNSLMAAAGVVAEDPQLRQFAWDWYRLLIPLQYDGAADNSRVPGVDNCRRWGDYGRSNGLGYSLYGIRGQIATAEIARHFGVDLYGYNDPETGRGLECALDFHAGFLLNPETWPWSQRVPITPKVIVPYQLAYLWNPKPEYLQVIEQYGRAADDRYLGMVHFTHGYGAFPWRVWEPQ